LTPKKRPPVPIAEEAGWALEPVWMILRKEFLLSLPGLKPWIAEPISYSLD